MSCEEFLRSLTKENGGYQPIEYLPHLTSRKRKGDYQRMLKMILDFCGDVRDKHILDIGPCFGYFSFELTKLGAYTTGVEHNKERFDVCRCLSEVYGFDPSNPKFINMDITDYDIAPDERYHYVLLLNVFHYVLEQNQQKAWGTLNRVAEASEAMFISMPHQRGLNARFQNEIPEIVTSKSILTDFKKLGTGRGRGGRHFYVFWK